MRDVICVQENNYQYTDKHKTCCNHFQVRLTLFTCQPTRIFLHGLPFVCLFDTENHNSVSYILYCTGDYNKLYLSCFKNQEYQYEIESHSSISTRFERFQNLTALHFKYIIGLLIAQLLFFHLKIKRETEQKQNNNSKKLQESCHRLAGFQA